MRSIRRFNRHYINFTLVFIFLSFNASAKRKVSGVYFYTCNVERKSQKDTRVFDKEFIFQVTEDRADVNKMARTTRWANVELTLNGSGKIEINIDETSNEGIDKRFHGIFYIKKFSYINPSLFFKDIKLSFPDNEVTYSVHCN